MANRHRSAARDRALTEKMTASSGWRFEPRAEMDEIDQRLIHAIRELPDAEREAFLLIAWDGLNPTRAAIAAGCSPATFRMRLHRARRRLRRQVGEVHPLSRLPEPTTPLEETR
jgi:RNA polymerase sigma factor (sigma-70 family)